VGKTGLWQGETCLEKGIFGDLVSGESTVWGIWEREKACYIFHYNVKDRQAVSFKRPEGFLASNIVLCPSNESAIAFIEWHRDWMPWDQSHLVIWDGTEKIIQNPYGPNIQQVQWVDEHTLVMIAQVDNWWNLVAYHIQGGSWRILVARPFDCLVPLWGRGERTLRVHQRKVFFCEQQEDRHVVQVFDMDQGHVTQLFCPLTYIECLCVGDSGGVLVKGGDPWHEVTLWHSENQFITKYEQTMPKFNLRKLGETVFSWLYEMKGHRAIVISAHGGPTGQHALVGDQKMATFLSDQISVCALDYHGSTGRGAQFRNSIYGRWGQVDVDDCVQLIKTIQNLFPKLPIFLKGNSAGAMTCLLAASKIQVSGIFMRYPVLNLSALVEDDALFEGNYLKRLLPPSLYDLDLVECAIQCRCPLLIQQGDEDPVVSVVDVSDAVNRVYHAGAQIKYVLHAGEGHGFRSQESQSKAQDQELEFIRRWSLSEPHRPIE
jgi:dienelactone hydrolase